MIEQHHGSVTISGAADLAALYRCTLLGIRQRRHDGLPSSDLQQLALALRRAHDMSQPCREVAPAVTTTTGWEDQQARDWCNVAEAAEILRLSKRQVQRLAGSPGGLGVRVGHTWRFRRARLLVLAKERARDRASRVSGQLEAI